MMINVLYHAYNFGFVTNMLNSQLCILIMITLNDLTQFSNYTHTVDQQGCRKHRHDNE
jgi:hypothetical protein